MSRSVLQLLTEALPVTSADRLLGALSAVWSAELGARQMFVSLVADQTFFGHWTEPEQPPRAMQVSAQDVPLAEWSAARAVSGMGSRIGDDTLPAATVLKSVSVVEFKFEGRPVGGVLSFDGSHSGACSAELIDASARLIVQLRLLRAAHDGDELRRQKLEAMAEFAAGAGHEINNPVATIAGRAALLLRSESDPERRRALETIGGQAYRIRDMIGDAMTTARPPLPVKSRFPGAEVLRDVVGKFESLSRSAGVTVRLELDDALTAVADREQFAVVVATLVRNSLEAGGDSVRIVWQKQPDGAALLSVTDHGPGLTDVEREHLFDPFFSGRQAGRGLGFGLTKCWRIVEMHGGRIGFLDVEPSGLQMDVIWPAASAAARQIHEPY